ncbi:Uncharacterised protein [Halioglobus japonicus]|nr:Uncharacterised protein [Halioglobus japonicus]
MSKATLKTVPTKTTPRQLIGAVEHPKRRVDAKTLLALFNRVTGLKPRVWVGGIIGYGRYHYVYESGRKGDFFMTGFSPRKSAMSIYILPGYQDLSEMLDRLGKHKSGKSCLYINKLEDIDLTVLEELITYGINYLETHYETSPN